MTHRPLREVEMIVSKVPLSQDLIDLVKRETGENIFTYKDEKEAMSHLPEAEILLSFGDTDAQMLEQCKNLKWLYTFSAGVDRLPFDALKKKNILVSNASGIHARPMSEYVMSMILHFHHGIQACTRAQAEHKWAAPDFVKPHLSEQTLCVVGAGSIGQALGKLAKFFGMQVIGVKRTAQPLEYFDEVVATDGLNEALKKADYVAVITPLTEETYHLIDKEQFAAMKDSAVIVNISRGDTINEVAMIEALEKKQIAGAGLDVFHTEPLPKDSPLWDRENVVVTPHFSGHLPDYTTDALRLFIDNLRAYRAGSPLPTGVDLDRQY